MNTTESINLDIIKPNDELSRYVHSVWFAKNTTNSNPLYFEILNDGCMSILFNFSDDILLESNTFKLIVNNQPVLSGASSDLSKISFQGEVNALGIRFLPTANLYFFNDSIASLAQSLLLINNAMFDSIENLTLKLNKAVTKGHTNTSIYNIIKVFLMSKINEVIDKQVYCKNDVLINNIVRTISENSQFEVETLCLELDINMRQLQRLFKKYIGITAKSFIRLNRIQSVKDQISNNTYTTLTNLSCESGYFDQSHFIRDFKMFMELTPSQYIKRQVKLSNEE